MSLAAPPVATHPPQAQSLILALSPRPEHWPQRPVTQLHAGAFESRAWVLALAADERQAVRFDTSAPPAEYPPVAFWTTPPHAGAGSAPDDATVSRSRFLIFPLNEMVDEHYSVYLCRLERQDMPPPRFCV